MQLTQHSDTHQPALAWLALLVLALAVYFFGLGGQYIPSNGDELVYAHIARLTAASQQWLPLVSELDHMRNTKPPLLFWQAMVAGDWGRHWSLFALRLPSLIYTLLVAGAIGWSAQKMTRNLRTACLAACVYLAFFCTFRYSRPFLTSAPESFWLNVPMFWLLWHSSGQAPSRQKKGLGWPAHVAFGLALGLGLAYKSFALIAPAAAALWCAQLLRDLAIAKAPPTRHCEERSDAAIHEPLDCRASLAMTEEGTSTSSTSPSTPSLSWRSTLQITAKVSLSAAIALGIFALWFVLDPDPRAVWQEFVIGENASKLSSDQGYWHRALRGGGASMWAQMLAYVQNAGLLALPVIGLAWFGLNAWRARDANQRLTPALLILLSWLAVWLLVFTLPSQRSARYVIPAMPALALLLALYWERIARPWFVLTLLLGALFIGVLARIAWAGHDIGIASNSELFSAMLAGAAALALLLGGLIKPAWTRFCALAVCLMAYACFGLTIAPLNGSAGQYQPPTVAQLQQARVAVPNGFNGQFERFQFLLPGNRFVPYEGERRTSKDASANAAQLQQLLRDFDAVAWLQSDASEQAPPCLPNCVLLGTRWEVKGRHQSGEITLANIWYPQVWLFRREWLLGRAGAPASEARP